MKTRESVALFNTSKIISGMKKTLIYILLSGCITLISGCGQNGRIGFVQLEDQIDIVVNDKLITSYLYGSHLSKPVLHPVRSPSGETVTRWYPFKEIEGESNDHPHQTGVYFTYGSAGEVNGNSFWFNPHDRPPFTKEVKLPRISHINILEMREGRDRGTLETLNHWMDKSGKPIIEENRVMEFYVQEDEYIIDFTIRLTAIDTTVKFLDTKEGLFAIRVADWLAENARGTLYESTGEYLNPDNERTERNIWGKRARWMRLEGEIDNKNVGVAIFHHPQSFNYPAFWHARGYGLFAANPLGQFDFEKDTGHENPRHLDLTLKPGESALFKFRMTVYEGTRGTNELERVFNDFSRARP